MTDDEDNNTSVDDEDGHTSMDDDYMLMDDNHVNRGWPRQQMATTTDEDVPPMMGNQGATSLSATWQQGAHDDECLLTNTTPHYNTTTMSAHNVECPPCWQRQRRAHMTTP
ncbi:uncharacterized protein LACBIDRAFT_313431 [Laccaria bicolor S238N-H82]|uniref:Predicted protein n=1 Tax=Laccaria bicolor (strain S238N-H82 / ATCC MYA-4686) TaxID=486041 RepID=B0D013_LACBS|nr:uncharacterized protein LACBIDRAFT_313431 [Laccaria bicolor S238N-H82]EDR11745.1 predicted protein [Laccaria bicolor S238N-H82]|eukprot:XP_001877642.1 predicted protein [Laccaria bicolor S238N-H82]